MVLAPLFADDGALDESTVMREMRQRVTDARLGRWGDGLTGEPLKAPSAAAIQRQAAGGACEAYPLLPATPDNGYTSVKLYIDEIGALRGRPRNARAEELATAAGLAGLSIHGDAHVGRCSPERNLDFSVDELAHDAPWVVAARAAHMRAATSRASDTEHLASGGGDEEGTWSQTEEDVEVRVAGAPEGAARRSASRWATAAARRSRSRSTARRSSVAPLFARVTPDECTWTVDGGAIVVTMQKAEPRPWASLALC